MYHQFDINLKKYLAGNSEEYTVIGTEMVDYTYTLSGNGFSKTIEWQASECSQPGDANTSLWRQ